MSRYPDFLYSLTYPHQQDTTPAQTSSGQDSRAFSSVLYLQAMSTKLSLKRNDIRMELWRGGRTPTQHVQGPWVQSPALQKKCHRVRGRSKTPTSHAHNEKQTSVSKAAHTFRRAAQWLEPVLCSEAWTGPGLRLLLPLLSQLRSTCLPLLGTAAWPGPTSTTFLCRTLPKPGHSREQEPHSTH